MAGSRLMDKVEGYYSQASGDYSQLQSNIEKLRDGMLEEKTEADKAHIAYVKENDKLSSAQRRRDRIEESISRQKDRRREIARSSVYSEEQKDESRDEIDREIDRLKDELDEVKEDIRLHKEQAAQYHGEEKAHTRAAAKMQKQLKSECAKCGKVAKALNIYAQAARQESEKTTTQETGFSNIPTKRFAKSAQSHAQQDRGSLTERFRALSGQLSSLASKYALLAQTDCGEEIGDDDQKDAGSSGSQRGYQIAVGAVAAVSMITGAVFHASRPIDTFDAGSSSIQIVNERMVGIDDALTGPDQIIDDKKRREDMKKDMEAKSKERAWKY